MKKIENGFLESLYLNLDGTVYDSESNQTIKANDKHFFYLKTDKGNKTKVSLRPLYKLVYNKRYCEDNIEDLDGELWKPIKEANDLYYISNMGRVKSFQGYNSIILKPYVNNEKGRYQKVDMFIDGCRQIRYIHRLVADAFLPLPESIEMQLHHKDGNVKNNAASNLEWLTPNQHRQKHKELKENKKSYD